MANRKTSAIDKLRTKIWAEMVNFAAGDMAPTALEAHLKDLRDRRTGGAGVEGGHRTMGAIHDWEGQAIQGMGTHATDSLG